MLFYIIFISYSFVIVLADNIDLSEYITELYITNGYMEKAYDMVGNHGNLNGLAYTIKTTIGRDAYTMDELNFMFAIPDQADVFDLKKYLGRQRILQNEIFMALRIDKPPISRDVHWTELGCNRRVIVRKAIIQLFVNDVYPTNGGTYSINQKCLLIGLALSTKRPLQYTEYVEVKNNCTCVINNVKGIHSLYKEFDNEFYEVEYEQGCIQIQSLIEQLNMETFG
ncbi:uncharacterized protein LOC126835483 [Adelges cooleyi]|uniref:uncharacterized protein LOC126835483 n=1 Tax=Adelges cooleyi TaxID=133065 RepID=UPI0021807E3B|nr:uncharacterized protein LOC126835483 [Adelges cooleyi]XP_050424078.1 uncharacterized protein LOC126835483 [Adelges cooleyi]